MTSNSFRKDEKEFMELIEGVGLPDDYSEVALEELEDPDSETVERIRKKTLEKLGSSKKNKFRSKLFVWAAAVLLMAAVTTVAVVGPSRVIASIEDVLKLVPGFGLREEEDVQVALEEEFTVELDYMDLTVVGLKSNGERTTLELQVDDLDEEYYLRGDFFDREIMREDTDEVCPIMGPRPTERPRPIEERWPKLVDDKGNSFRADRWSPDYKIISGQTIPHGGEFGFAPLESETSSVTLVLPDPGAKGKTVSIEIPLDRKGGLQEISIPSEHSKTLHDVTLSGSAKAHENETLLTLAVKPGNKLWEDRHFDGNYMLQNADIYTLKDDRGNEYSYRPEDSTYYDYIDVKAANIFVLSFDSIEQDADYLKLKVSSLLSSEREETNYFLNLPGLKQSEEDFVPLNDRVKIGTQKFEVTGLERLENGIKVHLDMESEGEENMVSLVYYSLDNIRTTNRAKWDSDSLEAIEFNFMDKDFEEVAEDKIIIKVNEAIVETPGPWKFKIPLERNR